MNIFYKTITIIVFAISFIAFSSYFDYFIIFDLNKIKIKLNLSIFIVVLLCIIYIYVCIYKDFVFKRFNKLNALYNNIFDIDYLQCDKSSLALKNKTIHCLYKNYTTQKNDLFLLRFKSILYKNDFTELSDFIKTESNNFKTIDLRVMESVLIVFFNYLIINNFIKDLKYVSLIFDLTKNYLYQNNKFINKTSIYVDVIFLRLFIYYNHCQEIENKLDHNFIYRITIRSIYKIIIKSSDVLNKFENFPIIDSNINIMISSVLSIYMYLLSSYKTMYEKQIKKYVKSFDVFFKYILLNHKRSIQADYDIQKDISNKLLEFKDLYISISHKAKYIDNIELFLSQIKYISKNIILTYICIKPNIEKNIFYLKNNMINQSMIYMLDIYQIEFFIFHKNHTKHMFLKKYIRDLYNISLKYTSYDLYILCVKIYHFLLESENIIGVCKDDKDRNTFFNILNIVIFRYLNR